MFVRFFLIYCQCKREQKRTIASIFLQKRTHVSAQNDSCLRNQLIFILNKVEYSPAHSLTNSSVTPSYSYRILFKGNLEANYLRRVKRGRPSVYSWVDKTKSLPWYHWCVSVSVHIYMCMQGKDAFETCSYTFLQLKAIRKLHITQHF